MSWFSVMMNLLLAGMRYLNRQLACRTTLGRFDHGIVAFPLLTSATVGSVTLVTRMRA